MAMHNAASLAALSAADLKTRLARLDWTEGNTPLPVWLLLERAFLTLELSTR